MAEFGNINTSTTESMPNTNEDNIEHEMLEYGTPNSSTTENVDEDTPLLTSSGPKRPYEGGGSVDVGKWRTMVQGMPVVKAVVESKRDIIDKCEASVSSQVMKKG
ncbi:hypothetical protein DACRYDRAFT_107447 [Dacryopinax primogenitus]|uniref:Uncharacterized protein n=1 Tax=Dacryopinax primogenitus (strain DJM 731) TaxID=1858805 RepID=M5G0R6_DACPD|nr:uncharacterized protein DACRYDRAFT_107447 [Dacryopinax primogenitus]EJU01705.1 hypothetical protein DACRYDRAFT_107447 [Dacryopinax primogenitus]